MTREIRLFGVAEETLHERLCDLLDQPESGVTLSYSEGHGVVTLTGDPVRWWFGWAVTYTAMRGRPWLLAWCGC